MKKSICFSIALGALFAVVVGCSSTNMTTSEEKTVELRPKMALKVGEELYTCNCGTQCPCNTLSRNAEKCTCGVEMKEVKT